MAEDAAERLRRLMGASGVPSARSLPGSNQTSSVGTDGTSKPRLSAETFQQPQQSNVRTLYLTDGTGSMWEYISAVKRVIQNVGRQTLDAKRNIEAMVALFDEHQEQGYTSPILTTSGIKRHSDFLQYNEWTTSPAALESQVANLIQTTIGNGTGDEPYECAAKWATDLMIDDRKQNPARVYGVVIFGDSIPHGAPVTSALPCSHGVKADELETLTQVANRVYWVDCSQANSWSPWDQATFEKYTYGLTTPKETSVYLKFADAEPILEAALVGMAKKTESPFAFKDYLASLPPAQAAQVRGLLGNGK